MAMLGIVTLDRVLQWWNLLYILPLLMGIIYLGLYISTGLTFGEADLDADASGAVDHGLDGEPAPDHHLTNNTNFSFEILSWLSARKVPMSLMLMIFVFCWSAIGLSVNRFLETIWMPGLLIPLASIPLALLGGALITRKMSSVVGRFIPMDETSAKSKRALVGCTGEAITNIDQKFGLVQVRCGNGDLFQVPCRVAGDGKAISKGSLVLLADYNDKEAYFHVIPDELGVNNNP